MLSLGVWEQQQQLWRFCTSQVLDLCDCSDGYVDGLFCLSKIKHQSGDLFKAPNYGSFPGESMQLKGQL